MNTSTTPTVLCGITGGIAAYKTVEVVSALHKQALHVHVSMTKAARRFIQPLTFQAITGHAVQTSLFARHDASERHALFPHLYPASEARLFVVMPATANTIASLAIGSADNSVTASALALHNDCIKVFCPAMNPNMWNQSIVRDNAARLEERGWRRIGPATGPLACGLTGEGRMIEPDAIIGKLTGWLQQTASLDGKQVLILSGPTREHIDAVRFVGNPSSGRMGRALAEEAARRGALVRLVTGPVPSENLPRGQRISIHHVTSAQDMLGTAQKLFASADYILFAAAVADYTPLNPIEGKRPKEQHEWNLKLKPTPDIAATLGTIKRPGQKTAGFALQHPEHSMRDNAREKLKAKAFDLIVLNEVAAMNAEQAHFECLRAGANDFDVWGTLSKQACASRIFDVIAPPRA